MMVTNIYFALCWIPMAVFYKSTLLGFLAVCALYTASGFTVLCFGLCWLIGFKNKEIMHRVIVQSIIVIGFTITMRIFGLTGSYWFAPFATGLNVMDR
eukprot:UN12414